MWIKMGTWIQRRCAMLSQSCLTTPCQTRISRSSLTTWIVTGMGESTVSSAPPGLFFLTLVSRLQLWSLSLVFSLIAGFRFSDTEAAPVLYTMLKDCGRPVAASEEHHDLAVAQAKIVDLEQKLATVTSTMGAQTEHSASSSSVIGVYKVRASHPIYRQKNRLSHSCGTGDDAFF